LPSEDGFITGQHWGQELSNQTQGDAIVSEHIFISHASADDDFVKELRLALEGQGLTVWVDSRNLLPGQRFEPEIEQAIETARHVIVVLSKETVNSAWVRKEV
jgi:hypothetical protein